MTNGLPSKQKTPYHGEVHTIPKPMLEIEMEGKN